MSGRRTAGRHRQSVYRVSLFSGGAVSKGGRNPGARRKEKPTQGLGNKHFVPIDQWGDKSTDRLRQGMGIWKACVRASHR